MSYDVCHCTHDKATHHAGKDNCLAIHCECTRYEDQAKPKGCQILKASSVEVTIVGVDWAYGDSYTLKDLQADVKQARSCEPHARRDRADGVAWRASRIARWVDETDEAVYGKPKPR